MPEIGDRVAIAGNKVGQMAREGTVRAKTGNLIRVEWDSGEESTLMPAPGTLTVLRGRAARKAGAKKAMVTKQPTGTKKGAAARSAVTKSPAPGARKAAVPKKAPAAARQPGAAKKGLSTKKAVAPKKTGAPGKALAPKKPGPAKTAAKKR